MVRGMPEIEHVEQICTGCLVGKQKWALFPHQAEYKAEDVLELVHGDICGPISLATPSGNRYFILLVDDASRYMWLKVLPGKDGASAVIKQYQAAAEAEMGASSGHFDQIGGEFNSTEFTKHCAEHGVRRQLTTPYTPQQNGVVERRNQMVVGTA
jgi:transposase InsO family protein